MECDCLVCDGLAEITLEEWERVGRVREWGGDEHEVDCLIDEMQVLVDNRWKHLL